jgi:hypothetical protein
MSLLLNPNVALNGNKKGENHYGLRAKLGLTADPMLGESRRPWEISCRCSATDCTHDVKIVFPVRKDASADVAFRALVFVTK